MLFCSSIKQTLQLSDKMLHADREAAIVSAYPGTTRDALEVILDLGGHKATSFHAARTLIDYKDTEFCTCKVGQM